jgi:MYXO-CTERM domain-containing protein
MRALILGLSLASLALTANAHAHFALTAPPSVGGDPNGKGAPPCGPDTSATGTVTAATGGQPLTVNITETVGHKGFYRFALALKSASEFPTDAVVRDSSGNVLPILGPGTSATADYETTPIFPVIADHVFAHTDTVVQSFPSTAVPGQVILPNVNCDKCILQVDEFMAEHGSNGVAGYFYHHCAYLKITADPNQPIFNPNAASGGAGGSSAGAGGSPAGGASAGGSVITGVAGADAGGSGGASSAGSQSGGSGGAASLAGASGAPVSGGSPGAGGASSAASGASSASAPAIGGDDYGCSLSGQSPGSKPALALLFGLVLIGARRRRARSAVTA